MERQAVGKHGCNFVPKIAKFEWLENCATLLVISMPRAIWDL
jgi:hypothetical protein